jgi:hypothetical protein
MHKFFTTNQKSKIKNQKSKIKKETQTKPIDGGKIAILIRVNCQQPYHQMQQQQIQPTSRMLVLSL